MKILQWHIYIIGLVFGSCFFANCGNQQEGCIDPLAANFDVSAEKNCCCNYPFVVLDFKFLTNTEEYNIGNATANGDTLADANGNLFVVKNIRFLFSDFVFNKNESAPYVFDQRMKVFFKNTNDSIYSIDDYAAVSFTNKSIKTFSYKTQIKLNSLDFISGVSDSAYLFDSYKILSSSHPLYPIRGNFFDSTSLKYQIAIIDVLTLSDSTNRSIRIDQPDAPEHHFLFNNLSVKPGFDLNITANISLDKLFDKVNWLAPDQQVIRDQIKINITQMFVQ